MRSGRTFESATRIGFAARGLLYILIGWLFLRSGRSEDPSGIMDDLAGGGGRAVLAVMAAGLLAYGAWRLLDAWFDPEGRGSGAKGAGIRIARAVSGLVHLGLGIAALLRALGDRGSGGSGSTQEGAAETALSLPGGWIVLVLAAAGLAVAGLAQFVKAWKLDFVRRLAVTAGTRLWICWLGRAGFLARGAIFAGMAVLLWHAGMNERSQQAGGLGDSLASLPPALQTAVAAGLVLFGLFSLAEARYRRIEGRLAERLLEG